MQPKKIINDNTEEIINDNEKEIMAEKLIGQLDLTNDERVQILEISDNILKVKTSQNESQKEKLNTLNSELNELLNKYTEEKLVPNEPNIKETKNIMQHYKESHSNTEDYFNEQLQDKCLFNIIDGEKIEKVNSDNPPNQAFYEKSFEVWETIKTFFLRECLEKIKYLQTFSVKNIENSLIGGGLSQHEDGNYILTINIMLNMRELPYILYHEYGHYISLNENQLNNKGDQLSYITNYEDAGFKEDSYIYKFYDRFYKYIYDDMQTDREGYLFYLRHKNEFVSLYAASHYFDDFAESFACFILDKETSGGKEKINFFNEFPELVKLKEKIQVMLSNNNLRSPKSTDQIGSDSVPYFIDHFKMLRNQPSCL